MDNLTNGASNRPTPPTARDLEEKLCIDKFQVAAREFERVARAVFKTKPLLAQITIQKYGCIECEWAATELEISNNQSRFGRNTYFDETGEEATLFCVGKPIVGTGEHRTWLFGADDPWTENEKPEVTRSN